MAMTPDAISTALRRCAAASPERTALVAPDEGAELTFGQIASLAMRLVDLDGGSGGRVALYTESRIAQAAVLAAGLMAGFVVVPINPAATNDAVNRLVRHARATLFIRDAPVAGIPGTLTLREESTTVLLDALPPGLPGTLPEPGRGGMLVYTSGSTGAPKGVLLDERNIGANVAFAIDQFGYDADWVTGSLLPLFHTFTVISDLLPMLVCGGRVILTPGFSVPRLKLAARAFAEHRVRSYSGVPIIFDMMLAMRFPLPPSVRFAIAGAAPLSDETQARYLATYGHPILPCYGLTETTCFAAASTLGEIRPRAVGKAAGIEIDIVDDDAASLPVGATGEICFRGPSILGGGYFEDEGKHRDSFRRAGWFLSGDVGRLDADGFLYITGRKKNMLIRGGEKVYLEDVDRCLEAHPAVAEACSVRIPPPGDGARQAPAARGRHEDEAVAFIVTHGPDLDRVALGEHVIAALGPFSRLDDIVMVDTIPRSPSGKPLRESLLATYLATR